MILLGCKNKNIGLVGTLNRTTKSSSTEEHTIEIHYIQSEYMLVVLVL